MLTIILTIILFCILAAIYALYVGKIEGGVGPIDTDINMNRIIKLVINIAIFTCIESDGTIYRVDAPRVRMNSVDNKSFNGAGCLWFNCQNMIYHSDTDVSNEYYYVFPEIGAYSNANHTIFIIEPHVYHYENINTAGLADVIAIIKETINIYKQVLQYSNYMKNDIINQLAVDTGYMLNCDVLTTTDAEFIETMKNDHPMLYVIHLTVKTKLNDAYQYIIDIFNDTLTSEKNISSDVHLLILQYLYENTATRNILTPDTAKKDIPTIPILFYYATLFTIIAKKIPNKTNQNYKTAMSECVDIIQKKREFFSIYKPEKPRYAPLFWNNIMQSILTKYLYIDTMFNISTKYDSEKLINYHNVYEFLISLTVAGVGAEDSKYVINKLNAELKYLKNEHNTFNMSFNEYLSYYNNINDTDVFNDKLKGVPLLLNYETFAEIINNLIKNKSNGANLSIDDRGKIDTAVVRQYINASDKINKYNSRLTSLYNICLILRIMHVSDGGIYIDNIIKISNYLRSMDWNSEFKFAILSLFDTHSISEDKKINLQLYILFYLLEIFISLVNMRINLYNFDIGFILNQELAWSKLTLDDNSPIFIIILSSIKYYLNPSEYCIKLKELLAKCKPIFNGRSDLDKHISLAKYLLKYINSTENEETVRKICLAILAD